MITKSGNYNLKKKRFQKICSNCDGVILPKVADEIKENAQVFCPRCDCKYETRNTTVIMVSVHFHYNITSRSIRVLYKLCHISNRLKGKQLNFILL